MEASTQTNTPLGALSALGTSVWLDSIRRSMFAGGGLLKLVTEDSVVGMTSNPAIFEKAILGSSDYAERLAELATAGHTAQEIYDVLSVEDVQAAADVLRPVYDATNGHDGYVSLEVPPDLALDAELTSKAAEHFWKLLDRPNVMIKIPGTNEGLTSIRKAIAAGINVNVTLLFAVDAYVAVADAYMSGLEDRIAAGEPIDRIASVASFFVSRVDSAVDKALEDAGAPIELQGLAAVANAQVAYGQYEQIVASDRFAAIKAKGGNAQRLLWASTGTKNPAYPDTKYVADLAGENTVNTMPQATLEAFQDHGKPHENLAGKATQASEQLSEVERAIDGSLGEVTDKLLKDGIKLFEDAMNTLLAGVEQQRAAAVSGAPQAVELAVNSKIGTELQERTAWGREQSVANRIWKKDYTLWGDSPDEITNRLGWLDIADRMLDDVDELREFALQARADGLTDCALLGMGGSSLAPEVLDETFGTADGFLKLHVLDSTHPDAIADLTAKLPLENTLFLVSSKSGGTLETLSYYRYFRKLVDDGSHFAAVTDPGSGLGQIAKDESFRAVFAGDPEIGGRYSALSPFGIVPAALLGIDLRAMISTALDAEQMARQGDPSSNPPLWIGLAAGELASRGRDKLTFIVDQPLEHFGIWVEQLVAESTGKQGTGLVPIASEPLGPPTVYGDDRIFVHMKGDDEEAALAVKALADAEQPVITIPVGDRNALGGAFFGWEFAIATAGAVLGINAFNQPNVQEAKDRAKQRIDGYLASGSLPQETADATDGQIAAFNAPGASSVVDALKGLLMQAEPGKYQATMAYLPPSSSTDTTLQELRTAVRDARRVATTTGYGPRFLHSTGQLHKGGPTTGVFLQITSDAVATVEIPDAGYDFGTLIAAQAGGDAEALTSRNLPFLRVHISGDIDTGMKQLLALVEEALR